MSNESLRFGTYEISTDPVRFDEEAFHEYLTTHSYWARGRLRETTAAGVANSIVFGAYDEAGSMVGAARVVTDCATFGWLCDLYVLESHSGQGLWKALVEAVRRHPCLDETKRVVLATEDAHGLYEQFGFHELEAPGNWMEYNGSTV